MLLWQYHCGFDDSNQIGLVGLIQKLYHIDKLGPNCATTARLMLSSKCSVKHHDSTSFVFVLPMNTAVFTFQLTTEFRRNTAILLVFFIFV